MKLLLIDSVDRQFLILSIFDHCRRMLLLRKTITGIEFTRILVQIKKAGSRLYTYHDVISIWR